MHRLFVELGRFTDAAGLNHDIIKSLHGYNIRELLHQVHLERAANTTVLQSHERVVFLSNHAIRFDETGIDIHLTDVVDDNGELDATFIFQYFVEVPQCFLFQSKLF